MQWKMIYLARRNPTLAAVDFAEAWRGHSSLGRQCRNVQDKVLGVTQCSRLLHRLPVGCSTDYDGVNLLRLRDRAAADDIWNDPETLAIMRPDEPRVFDRYVREFTLVASEHVVRQQAPTDRPDVPAGQAVLVAFIRLEAGQTKADFFPLLQAALGSTWAQAARIVINVVEPVRPPGYDFDAVVEWWFADADSLRHTLQQLPVATVQAALSKAECLVGDAVFMGTGVTHRRP